MPPNGKSIESGDGNLPMHFLNCISSSAVKAVPGCHE